jgi:CubicO group peptidase (beta-lactamase class C family)
MAVHHGSVVAEWGDTGAKTQLASVRKSLLSALIGIAVERKQILLNQPIGELGIDDAHDMSGPVTILRFMGPSG